MGVEEPLDRAIPIYFDVLHEYRHPCREPLETVQTTVGLSRLEAGDVSCVACAG